MKKAEQRDPVFLLDEVDKTGVSYQGDPAAALLEVLDPEQNHAFEDHYLGLEYDLSRVLFIATANQMDTIPLPLLDRMEVVNLSGYTVAEKKQIARNHLLPEILEQLKLEKDQIEFSEEGLDKVIQGHTREAGVRSLKRKLETIARKAIREFIEKTEEDAARETASATEDTGTASDTDAASDAPATATNPVTDAGFPKIVYDPEKVADALGRDRFTRDLKELPRDSRRGHRPGLDTGRRRHPLYRSDLLPGQGRAQAFRPAGRRHEGIGVGGAIVHQELCARTGH